MELDWSVRAKYHCEHAIDGVDEYSRLKDTLLEIKKQVLRVENQKKSITDAKSKDLC